MKDLTKMSVTKALLIIAIPTMISSLLQFSYNIIDMFYIGRYDRSGSLIASIGTSSLFVGIALGLNFLSVLGSGIKSSQALGKKDYDEFKSYVNTGNILNILISFIVCLLLFILSPFLISSLGIDDKTVYNNAVIYLKIYSFALFFNFLSSFYTRIMSSMGSSNISLKINSVGIILNIILDPILIFVFDLGLVGACIATVISNFVSASLFLYKYSDIFLFSRKLYDNAKAKIILKLSYPYVFQRIIFSFIGIIMGKIMLISEDSSAIAGQKLGLQIEYVTLMVIGGLLASVSAFTGQNFGAKETERIRKGFNTALLIGVCYTFFTSSIFIIFSNNIIGLFTDDIDTIYYGTTYIKLVAITQFFVVFEMVGNGFYNGISKPKIPTIISISITPLRIVFALALLPNFGVIGVFIGIVITSVLKGVISFSYYLIKIKPNLEAIVEAGK